MTAPAWHSDPTEVARVEQLLLELGVLTDDVAYYRTKPWKWDRERAIAVRLRDIMLEAGAIMCPEMWEMTAGDIVRLRGELEHKRAVRSAVMGKIDALADGVRPTMPAPSDVRGLYPAKAPGRGAR